MGQVDHLEHQDEAQVDLVVPIVLEEEGLVAFAVASVAVGLASH